MQLSTKLLKTLDTLSRDTRLYLVWHRHGRCSGTLREWEDVEERCTHLLQEIVGLHKLILTLTRETHNYIHAKKGIRHKFSNLCDTLAILIRRIATTHQSKDAC